MMGNRASRQGKLLRHPDDGWRIADPVPMGRRGRRALRALIRTLCPPEPVIPDLEDRIENHVRRMMRYMHPLVARGLRLCFHLLNWSPLWLLRNTSPIDRLPRDRSERVLEALAEGRFQMLLIGVRSLILSTYFDQAEVHRAMNYQPLPFMRERIALRRALLAPARSRSAALTGANA